uniref:Uncharacterized protein n=1 Tax=Steinernema glaseri TaxID=37863 RepID=A0A1I7Y7G4_9BILA
MSPRSKRRTPESDRRLRFADRATKTCEHSIRGDSCPPPLLQHLAPLQNVATRSQWTPLGAINNQHMRRPTPSQNTNSKYTNSFFNTSMTRRLYR